MSDATGASHGGTTTTTTGGAGGAGGTAGPGITLTTPTDWTTGLSDEQKGYIQTKGFKGITDVVDSYRNYEKLQGVPQDRLLKIPESMDTPEGRAIWQRLGAPKEAKDYTIDIPKQHGDEALANWIRDVAFKGNFTQRQVETLVKEWNARSEGFTKAATLEAETKYNDQETKLKTEWGAALDQNVQIAKTAAVKYGFNEQVVNALEGALGYDGVMKLLYQLGSATGESAFVTGQGANNGVVSAATAKGQIDAMLADKSFAARLRSGDVEAKRQWDNAHKMAYPGTMSL